MLRLRCLETWQRRSWRWTIVPTGRPSSLSAQLLLLPSGCVARRASPGRRRTPRRGLLRHPSNREVGSQLFVTAAALDRFIKSAVAFTVDIDRRLKTVCKSHQTAACCVCSTLAMTTIWSAMAPSECAPYLGGRTRPRRRRVHPSVCSGRSRGAQALQTAEMALRTKAHWCGAVLNAPDAPACTHRSTSI